MDTTEGRRNAARRSRRPKIRRQFDRWHAISEGLLVAVVVGSALAIGTVHISSLLVVSALALVGATIELLEVRRVPWPAVVLAALGLFSALQAVPLPAAWVSRASPASAEIWLRCLVPFGEPALRRFPLSLDAGASVAEALKWLTYAAVYILAIRTRARHGSTRLALLLFGSAALVTLITLAHGVAHLTVLYGIYTPHFAVGRWNVGPLLNSNNLAGYAILGLFSGGGLLLSDRSPLPRPFLSIGLGVIAAALCLSGSRAAVLSVLILGLVTLVWLGKGQRLGPWARNFALGMAPLLVGMAIAVAVGTARDASQYGLQDVQRKVSVWLWSLPMLREHLLFGVGRGAFETAFPPYRQALDYDWSVSITQAENFVVQWIAEWGVPVGLCAVLVITGYVLREWHRSRRDRLSFMMMTGLVALLLQNLADLGLEVPAVAIAAVLALAAGERPKAVRRPDNENASQPAWLAVAASAPAFAIWTAAMLWSRVPIDLERSEVSDAYRELAFESTSERGEFRSRLHEAVLRHPGEAYFPLLGALFALRTDERNALPWIARSLALAPTSGPVNLALAQLLQAHGATAQALFHLRLAAQYDRTLAGLVSARAALWAPSIDQLLQAIPEGPDRLDMLLDACARERRMPQKVACFRRSVQDSPGSSPAQEKLGESLLRAIQAGQPPCEDQGREDCIAEAEGALSVATRLEPKSWHASYLISKLLLARKDTVGAAQLLTRICPQGVEGEPCWREAVVTAIKTGSDDVISTAANGFAARPCDGGEACADAFDWLASNLQSGGKPVLAIKFFGKAAEADPSARRWLKVAEHATEAHLYGVARSAVERADRSPDASVITRARAQLVTERIERESRLPL